MLLAIESGRYYKKLNPDFHFDKYLYRGVNKDNAEAEKLEAHFYDGDCAAVDKADKIIDIMTNLISGYKGIPCGRSEHYDKWYEVLVTAVYLYAYFYNEAEPILSVVYPRQYTQKLGEEAGVYKGDLEYIFQAVESANNFHGPQKWKAPADTPNEMLALAVFIYNNINTLLSPAD